MIWFIPGVIAGASMGVVVAGMLAAAKDCDRCTDHAVIVRRAYDVVDTWTAPSINDEAMADALHKLAEACTPGTAVR